MVSGELARLTFVVPTTVPNASRHRTQAAIEPGDGRSSGTPNSVGTTGTGTGGSGWFRALGALGALSVASCESVAATPDGSGSRRAPQLRQ